MIHTKGKTFTIERSKWLRGEGSIQSRLLRESDGRMCCIGQILRQCGVQDETMMETKVPSDCDGIEPIEGIVEKRQDEIGDLFHPRLIFRMFEANDGRKINETDRESRLSELAQQAGFSLKFVD